MKLRVATLLQRAVQALLVAVSVKPTFGYLLDATRNAPPRPYTARRTGTRLHLRARGDLQVAREMISKDGYSFLGDIARTTKLTGAPIKVLDVGANIGLFTLAACRELGPDTRIIAVEPDPQNVPLLRSNVDENGLADKVMIHAVAAAPSRGVLRFASGRNHISRAAHLSAENEGTIIEVPTEDFFELAADVHLVKMDIEGGEWPILRDQRLRHLAAAAVIMEWHTRGSEVDDAHTELRRLLDKAGYTVVFDDQSGRASNGSIGHQVGTVCAVRSVEPDFSD